MDLERLLNPEQYAAAVHTEGPLLILAGAGSGKTRVITHRLVHLHTAADVPLHRILAVTFTNKAAGEMLERVQELLREARVDPSGGQCWISTFHAFCARLLRMYAEHAKIDPHFTIVDDEDQLVMLKRALARLEIDAAPETIRGILSTIDDAKNRGIDPDGLDTLAVGARAEQEAEVYRAYQDELRRNQSLDFGDLLMESVLLLRNNPAVQRQCQRRWSHLMVDEFQDTNPVQYELLRLLTGPAKNLVVVGDDDQSIYRWRGATVRNILDFEGDYPEARVIKLEQNYRSTQVILDAAAAIVEKIGNRREKRLWTERKGGELLTLFTGHNGREEAAYVARAIQRLAARGDVEYGECAVFYRTNAQSRQIEEQFRAQGLPYQIVGGVSFYARSEVKDLLAYLKIALNPANTLELRRIINVPRRGIGDKTIDRLEELARSMGKDAVLYDAIEMIARGNLGDSSLKGKQVEALTDLFGLIDELRHDLELGTPPSRMAQRVIERTGFLEWLEQKEPTTAEDRKQNLYELIAAMSDFEREGRGGLVEFLERSALVQQADTVETDGVDAHVRPARPVTMMTVHAAKGLEFDAVFVIGMEEGLFPLVRERDRNAPDLEERLEEERRLFYVAMTRARRFLTISNAKSRRLYGKDQQTWPSTFLADLPISSFQFARETVEREVIWGRPPAQGRGDVEWDDPWGGFDQSDEVYRSTSSPPTVKLKAPKGAAFDEFDQRTVEYDDAWGSGGDEGGDAEQGDGLVGRTVSHAREGFGTVLRVSGAGDMASVTVLFATSGRELTVKRKFLKLY